MLVHVCCSVDSHYFLSELKKKYPDEKMIAFFYNPNIHPKEEYDMRLLDVKRSCKILGVDLIEGQYDLVSWLDRTYGFENEEEKGERCSICFDERLLKTALLAMQLNENKVSTTLLASPMKSKEELFSQGDKIIEKYGLDFIKIDVRSNGGTQAQSKMAKETNLYRQNYCGCLYALNKQRTRSNKVSIELFNDIGGQILHGSPKHTIDSFMEFYRLESQNIPCLLQKNSLQIHRILNAKVKHEGVVIPSYIFTHSKSCKNLKSNAITWVKRKIEGNLVELGYCDNMQFITIESINLMLNKNYKNVLMMLYNPPNYASELELRSKILGMESIKPFIILDSKPMGGITLNIESISQVADVFEVIKFEL